MNNPIRLRHFDEGSVRGNVIVTTAAGLRLQYSDSPESESTVIGDNVRPGSFSSRPRVAGQLKGKSCPCAHQQIGPKLINLYKVL